MLCHGPLKQLKSMTQCVTTKTRKHKQLKILFHQHQTVFLIVSRRERLAFSALLSGCSGGHDLIVRITVQMSCISILLDLGL